MTPSRRKKAFHTREINCGPRSDTISSSIPKFLKTRVNNCSAVSRAVGNPRRGINLQVLEKRSTIGCTCDSPTQVGQSRSLFPRVTRASVEWVGVRACPPEGDKESMTWHRLSNCGHTWWNHETYWATSTELGGVRGSVGCLDVQSPVH